MVEETEMAALRRLLAQGQAEQAEQHALRLRRDAGDSANLQHLLARSLLDQSAYSMALREALMGLELPGNLQERTDLRSVAIVAYGQLGLLEDGCAMAGASKSEYDTVWASDHAWPGHLFWMLGANEEALASYSDALACWPDDCNLLYRLGMVRLSQGDSAGMKQYGSYTTPTFWRSYYPHAGLDLSRMWQGQSLSDQSITVTLLGGVGDAIQFVRYAHTLRDLGASDVAMQLPTERIRGFLGSCADVRLVPSHQPVDTDWWVPSFGLCTQLFPMIGPVPAARYLRAPPSALAEAQLGLIRRRARGRRCVALAWHSDMPDGASRSLPLAEVLPLLGLPNIHWVVTQRGVALRQFLASGLQIDCSVLGESATFDDTAALMAGLDGVVTIESYSLHMAGAMGVSCWFLAGRALDWRHLNQETESIWYPSVQLLRQPRLGDWRSAVASLKAQLQRL